MVRPVNRFAGTTRLLKAGPSQCIHPFVIRMTRMSCDPVPFEPMAGRQGIEAAP